jgi:hypothetical protein
MSRRTRIPTALGVIALVAVAACGSKAKKAAAPSTTTTTVASTTTSAARGDLAPLTGLPLADAGVRTRVALVIKIDNAPKARPQFGLSKADIVVEEKVEDGVTRFFTIFQSQDADRVEPVRSARSTDIALVGSLNHPLFAYSGANAVFQARVQAAPLTNVGYDALPGEFHRDGGRPAPYNLFTATNDLRKHAPASSSAPAPWFTYRAENQPATGAGLAATGGVHLEYLGQHINTVVEYVWDGATKTWARTQDGGPHNDATGARVAPRNVVVQFVDYRDTGLVDRSNTAVPEAVLSGSGEAWVLTDAKVIKGTWSKPSDDKATTFTDPEGKPIPLTPGQTWLELAVRGNPNKLL